MELEIMYPEIIFISIFLALIPLFSKRKEKRFKDGVIVANTKYVKETKYYKNIIVKYRTYSVLIKIFCISLVIVCAILTSRYHQIYHVGKEINNRDIILCMDISASVNNLNKDLVKTLKETVSHLKTERFGIVVFDSMPLSLVPLTTDYNYVISILNDMEKAFNTKFNPFSTSSSFVRDYLYAGVQLKESENPRGYSLVGDGLAYCASNFNNKEKRTKIIILTTDNEVVGKEMVSREEAKDYCELNNIRVFSIGTENIYDENKEELINISNSTNGEYYDYKDYSTKDIVEKINSTAKSAIVKASSSYTRDYPEKILPFILIIMPILFILEWRIRI